MAFLTVELLPKKLKLPNATALRELFFIKLLRPPTIEKSALESISFELPNATELTPPTLLEDPAVNEELPEDTFESPKLRKKNLKLQKNYHMI